MEPTYGSAIEYGLEQHWQSYHEYWSDELVGLPIAELGPRVYVIRDTEKRWRGWSQLSREEAFKDAYRRALGPRGENECVFERGDHVKTIRAVKIDTDSALDVTIYSGVKGLIRAINHNASTLYVLFDCYPVIQAWVGPDDVEAVEDAPDER